MQRDTGELLTDDEVKKRIEVSSKRPSDFVETGVTVGMKVKVGNILCRVRKVTRRDFVLRPIK